MSKVDTISPSTINAIPRSVALTYKVVPYRITDGELYLYCSEPGLDRAVENELEVVIGRKFILSPISPDLFNQLLIHNYRQDEQVNGHAKRQRVNATDIKKGNDFLWDLIADANLNRSSDIHIEAYDDRCRIRFRIDGVMIEWLEVGKASYPALINQIKILANLDIAEKRLPQDGRIFYNTNGDKFDIRVSVLPTIFGEKCVLRLLKRDVSLLDLSHLGFSPEQLDEYAKAIANPNGVILISGPTGSGKTTTLYATLNRLNKVEKNILTIEDPIEYTLEGINQVQLKESIGLTFANALRTFLRQDPDIIMLGEIRDNETAQIAIRSALTGHLVFSTVHTNSAWGTITRLIDLGVAPYLVADTVRLAMSQRLVRVLCPKCKESVTFQSLGINLPQLKQVLEPDTKVFKAVGCSHCFYTGYYGRKAIYEMIPMNEELSESIRKQKYSTAIFKNNQHISLSHAAIKLVKDGETSIDEILSLVIW